MTTIEQRTQTRRLRNVVRAVTILGILASITASVIHTDLISQAVTVWTLIALLLAVEIVTRYPLERHSWRNRIRNLATGVVALITVWASYRHLADIAHHILNGGTL